jgi:hypothetical protein
MANYQGKKKYKIFYEQPFDFFSDKKLDEEKRIDGLNFTPLLRCSNIMLNKLDNYPYYATIRLTF